MRVRTMLGVRTEVGRVCGAGPSGQVRHRRAQADPGFRGGGSRRLAAGYRGRFRGAGPADRVGGQAETGYLSVSGTVVTRSIRTGQFYEDFGGCARVV